MLRSMNTPDVIDDCNCFALRQAARFVTQLYEGHLERIGITSVQFSILRMLLRQPNVTMTDLAESLVTSRTTLVRALKPLQRDGFVLTEAATHQARTRTFKLTQSGEGVLERALDAWGAAQKEFEATFGQTRSDTLRNELQDLTAPECAAVCRLDLCSGIPKDADF
jgi:DNA-binding MarR family transcriptional regulator